MAIASVYHVVIDKELIDTKEYGINENEINLRTNERYLPNILVQLGIFKSKSEVRKNRPDLVRSLFKMDFEEIKIGKNRLWIIVGVNEKCLSNIISILEKE